MKNCILLFTLIIMVAFSTNVSTSEKISVNRTENKPYQSVIFDHDQHDPSDCKTCHHTGDMDVSCSSAGCHAGRDGTITFHEMCIGCHKDRFEKAPIECVGCHKIK